MAVLEAAKRGVVMEGHPIQGLMKTTMESIKDMVDVNTVVGDPVETPDGSVIMPISRVNFGFAAGGSEFLPEKGGSSSEYPFGGGSGAGASVQPVGFLVVGNGKVHMLPVGTNSMIDRLVDLAPQLLTQLQEVLKPSVERERYL